MYLDGNNKGHYRITLFAGGNALFLEEIRMILEKRVLIRFGSKLAI